MHDSNEIEDVRAVDSSYPQGTTPDDSARQFVPNAEPRATPSAVEIAVESVKQAVSDIDPAVFQAAVESAPVRAAFNPRQPRIIEPVPIELDRTRHLRLPFWALKRFTNMTGLNPWDSDKVLNFPPDLDVLCKLLYCALLDEDDSLTLDQVERMPGLEFGNVYYILHCLDQCWGQNMPAPDVGAADIRAPQGAPTANGARSGGTDPNAAAA